MLPGSTRNRETVVRTLSTPFARRKEWKSAKRVLALRFGAFSDVLMIEPALRALRAVRADRTITLLTSQEGAQAAELLNQAYDVISCSAPWAKEPHLQFDSAAAHSLIEELKRRDFDAAVVFTNATESSAPYAMICYMADIPLRLAHCRDDSFYLLTDYLNQLEPAQDLHEVKRSLELVASVGCDTRDERMWLEVPRAAQRTLKEKLEALAICSATPIVVLCPGTGASRYSDSVWAETADLLTEDIECSFFFTGSADSIPRIENIRSAMHTSSCSLAGKLTLSELSALISRAGLLVTADGAVAHIAAAVGTPVITLDMPSGTPLPWMLPYRALRSAADGEAQDVYNACLDLLFNNSFPEAHELEQFEPSVANRKG